MQQRLACFRVDLQAGGCDEIARRRVGLGAPDAVDGAIVEAAAGELALDVGDDLRLAAAAGSRRDSAAPPRADAATRPAAAVRISGRVAKIGAGCGPCCKNSALMKIAKVATVAISRPTNSRG